MDIDIDFRTDFDPLKVFKGITRASMLRDGELVPHNCGAYLQHVPTDPVTGLAAVPFKVAEDLGCFKIDFLHLNVYDDFKSKSELRALLKVEPDWNLLQIPSVIEHLFQLSKHADILQAVKPRSIYEIADCLALIRPQKRYVLPYYLRDREAARPLLYSRENDEDAYGFKKAHAIAYAYVIALQLHVLKVKPLAPKR